MNKLEERYPSGIKEIEKNFTPEHLNTIVNLEQVKEICETDLDLKKYYDEMIEYFYRYTENVCEYNEILEGDLTDSETNDSFQEIETFRKRLHDTMMDSVIILARLMNKKEKSGSWIEKLGNHRVNFANLALATTYRELLKEREVSQDEL